MRRLLLAVAAIATLSLCASSASASLLVEVNKSTQRMTVSRDGQALYRWPVSTGRNGYATPAGTFKPFRMERDHYSQEYDEAPMPYSVFFTETGIAIHGTDEERNLGHAVSHGCVRLSRRHAAVLWALIKNETMADTKILVRGKRPGPPPIFAEHRAGSARHTTAPLQPEWRDGPDVGDEATVEVYSEPRGIFRPFWRERSDGGPAWPFERE